MFGIWSYGMRYTWLKVGRCDWLVGTVRTVLDFVDANHESIKAEVGLRNLAAILNGRDLLDTSHDSFVVNIAN